MIREQITTLALDLYRDIVWHFWLKQEITLPWPKVRWVTVFEGTQFFTDNPTTIYENFLEEHVGARFNDWDLRLTDPGYNFKIKFKRSVDATAFILWLSAKENHES